jgi:hypothetical protein
MEKAHEERGYNGWTNYETWAVSLWLDNEQPSYLYWREQADRHRQEAPNSSPVRRGILTEEQEARFNLAKQLKEEVMDAWKRSPEDLRHLTVLSCRAGQNGLHWLNRVLDALGPASASAWAKIHYLDETKLAGTFGEEVQTLLEPLSGHKKGEERRELDLTRLDRLRLLIAYGIPDHCYERRGTGYAELVPGAALETTSEADSPGSASAARSEPVRVEMDPRSVCAGREDLPAFACLERRPVRNEKRGETVVHASLVVRLEERWLPVLRGAADGVPLHERPLLHIVKLLADSRRTATAEPVLRRLFIDQEFPQGSLCSCKATAVPSDPSECFVQVGPPQRLMTRVVERAKKADVELIDRGADEEADSASAPECDLKLSKDLRTLKACDDADADGPMDGDVAQWEGLFAYKSDGDDEWEQFEGPSGPAAEATAQLRPALLRTANGVVSIAGLVSAEAFTAEVCGIDLHDGEPRLRLRHPSADQQIARFVARFKPDDIGRDCEVEVLRLEPLSFGRGSALIVRELQTGVEAPIVACDLSFSNQPEVPHLVFQALGVGARFRATIAQIDQDAARVRLTTHAVAQRLLQTNSSDLEVGERQAEVLRIENSGVYVRLLQPADAEKQGTCLIARVPVAQLPSAHASDHVVVHPAYRTKTSVRWPDDQPIPDDSRLRSRSVNALDEGMTKDDSQMFSPRSVSHQGPMEFAVLSNMLAGLSDSGARAALYNLFQRSNELAAADPPTRDRFTTALGQVLTARVADVTSGGPLLESTELRDVPLFMPRQESSWNADEDTSGAMQIGSEYRVKVIAVRPATEEATVSLRQTQPNPYERFSPRDIVVAKIHKVESNGVELRVMTCEQKRTRAAQAKQITCYLRGWMWNNDRAAFPGSTIETDFEVGREIVAAVAEVNEDGLVLSSKLAVLISMKEQWDKCVVCGRIKVIRENGAEVELTPGITGWLGTSKMPTFSSYFRVGGVSTCLLTTSSRIRGRID